MGANLAGFEKTYAPVECVLDANPLTSQRYDASGAPSHPHSRIFGVALRGVAPSPAMLSYKRSAQHIILTKSDGASTSLPLHPSVKIHGSIIIGPTSATSCTPLLLTSRVFCTIYGWNFQHP